MAKKTINLGTGELTGDGESIRLAFDKINNNFDELYNAGYDLNAVGQNIVPNTDNTYDLGSIDKQWHSLYLSSDTIYLGGVSLRLDEENRLIIGDDSTVLGGAVSYNDLTNKPTIPSIGDITFTGSTISAPDDDSITIQALDEDSTLRSRISLSPDVGAVSMRGYSSESSDTFNTSDWDTATWIAGGGGGQVVIVNAAAINDFINDDLGSATGVTFSINGGAAESLGSRGYSGLSQTLTLYTADAPETDPTTVTEIEFFYSFSSRIGIDYDDGSVSMSARGSMNVSINSERDINLSADDDIRITGTDSFSLTNTSTTAPIRIITDDTNNSYTWEFEADGSLTFPDDTVQSTAYPGPITSLDGDVTGSVFADDSTLLVDGVAGKIVGPIETATVVGLNGSDLIIRSHNVESGTANDVLISGGVTADTGFEFGGSVKIQGGDNTASSQANGSIEIGTEHTNGITIGAYDFGDGFGSVVHLAGFQVLIGEASNRSSVFMKGAVDFSEATVSGLDVALTGDLTGSVFADDSTLLVDGVAGKIVGPIETNNITFRTDQDPGTWNDGSIETSFYSYLLNFPTNQPAVTAPLIVGWNDYAYIQPFLPTDIGASEATQGFVKRSLELRGGNATETREPGLLLLNGGSNSSQGLYGEVRINNLNGDVKIGNTSGTITIDGNTTVNKQLTVEESYSSTPTTKFFEIETGAGNNRLLRTGVNMSAFAQGDGPQLDLTSYRSSPANGDAGPEFVLRASTGASANDVIATIGTEVTDATDGDVTSKILFTVQNNGAEITPLFINGSTVDMQTADQVSISNEDGAVDIYGEVEFNNGTTSFQAGNSVDFNCPVDFNGSTVTNLSVSGNLITEKINEAFDIVNSASGVVVHDCVQDNIFVHTAMGGDFTANLSNLAVPQVHSTQIKMLLVQGSTPYMCTGIQIDSLPQTIYWENGAEPNGTANERDLVEFTIFRTGPAVYIVLGKSTSYS